MTHEGGCISIIDIHRTTARQLDLQRHVNTDIQAEMKIRRAVEDHERGLECGNVPIFHSTNNFCGWSCFMPGLEPWAV